MGTDFAAVAGLIGHPARSTMVDALLRGSALPAGELARLAKVKPATASEHLGRLIDGGLLAMEAHGRHRYYRIASTDVAEALEAFGHICPDTPVRSLRASVESETLRYARTCYDHLAGTLGVALLESLGSRRWLEYAGFELALTDAGRTGLVAAGVDLDAAAARRRAFTRVCLDWTERRHHLAGALGAAITTTLFEQEWIRRSELRSVIVTAAGRKAFLECFGVRDEVVAAA